MRKRELKSASKENTRMANLPNGTKPLSIRKAQACAIILSSGVQADGAHGEGDQRNLRDPVVMRENLRYSRD